MTSLSRRTFIASAAAAAAASSGAWAQGGYPARPVTFIVPFGAGGGTDFIARMLASLMEKELGQPMNVVNRTGGGGIVGLTAIATAQPDGYTLGMVTVETTMMHHQGLTDLTPASFTPLALVNEDPPGVHVSADSPHKNLKDLVAAIKANPKGKLKASGTGTGGSWHLGLVGFLQAIGTAPDQVAWVPSAGAAPAMQDLAAGGLDFVTCSVPEARAMLDAGRARSLAIMADQRSPAFPNVPTVKEELGVGYTMGAWRGIGGPKGIPQEIQTKLVAAIEKAHKSSEFQEFMKTRGFTSKWADAEGFAQFMAAGDKQMGTAIKAAGLAKA